MYSCAAQLIQDFEKNFATLPATVAEGYAFNQVETLKRINLYSNQQFVDGPSDEFGERVFFDISSPIVRNFAKNIDLDTKDIGIRATNGNDYFKSWIYRRAAKQWMRDTGLAKKLNSIPNDLCGNGTVVAKKIYGPKVFELTDLRNLANDPTARTLEDGGVSERHYFLPNELRSKKDAGWDDTLIEEAIADFLTNRSENYVGEIGTTKPNDYGTAQYICVHEYFGYAPRNIVYPESEESDPVLCHLVSILPETRTGTQSGKAPSQGTKGNEGLDLYKKEISEWPYKEVHFRKVRGRWMGRGLREDLFVAQEIKNTHINWQLLAMRLSQTIIFQTRNKTPLSNVISQTKNGTILKFGEGNGTPLERVDTSNQGIGDANVLAGEIRQLAAALGNSYEVTTGANLPSNTPFALGNLMNQNAEKEFEQVREDFGIFLTEIFEDWVLPELEKELKKGGLLEIVDKDEMAYIREQYVKAASWNATKKFLLMGKRPTVEQLEMVEGIVKAQLEQRDSLFIEWESDFLDIEKKIQVEITDERESLSMMQSLGTIMQAIGQNPALAQNPAFLKILDKIGLGITDIMPVALPPPAGAPAPAAAPAPAQMAA